MNYDIDYLVFVFCLLLHMSCFIFFFFFFNDTATTEIYTLSLHDALPILVAPRGVVALAALGVLVQDPWALQSVGAWLSRSEEHTSELQSQSNLVCRLLLEKKKKKAYRMLLQAQTITTARANLVHPTHLLS